MRILDRIAGDESGSSGLLMLAFRLNWLYDRVPEWTEQNILSRMRWEDGSTNDGSFERVRALWEVIAVRGSLSRDLIRVLGADLWTAVRRHKELGRGDNLVRLFIYLSTLGQPELIDENDSRELGRIAVKDRPGQVGIALAEVLKRSPGPVEDNWRAGCSSLARKLLAAGESSQHGQEFDRTRGDPSSTPVTLSPMPWSGPTATSQPLDDRQIGSVWHRRRTFGSRTRERQLDLLHRIVPCTRH